MTNVIGLTSILVIAGIAMYVIVRTIDGIYDE